MSNTGVCFFFFFSCEQMHAFSHVSCPPTDLIISAKSILLNQHSFKRRMISHLYALNQKRQTIHLYISIRLRCLDMQKWKLVVHVVLEVRLELWVQGKPIHPQASIQCVPSSYSLGMQSCCVTIKQSSLKWIKAPPMWVKDEQTVLCHISEKEGGGWSSSPHHIKKLPVTAAGDKARTRDIPR